MTYIGFYLGICIHGKLQKLSLWKMFLSYDDYLYQCVFTFTDIFGTVHQKATHNKALSFIQMRSINVLLFLLSSQYWSNFTTWKNYNFCVAKVLDVSRLTTRCLSVNGWWKCIWRYDWQFFLETLSFFLEPSNLHLVYINFQRRRIYWHSFWLCSMLNNKLLKFLFW